MTGPGSSPSTDHRQDDPERVERCRRWIDKRHDRCNEPAVGVVWGKLVDPEALGPRCGNCMFVQLGRHVWDLKRDGYAIYWIDREARS